MTFSALRRELRRANPFLRSLRGIFRTQGEIATRAILNNLTLDLGSWQSVMASTAEAHLGPVANRAFRQVLREYLGKGGRLLNPSPALVPQFTIEVPEVREFAKRMAVNFAATTNKTSEAHAEQAREHFREELAQGLERGELHGRLTQRLDRIFQNPKRTQMIAHNEASRALHGGQMLAAERFTEPVKKEWLASSDACPVCLELDGKVVALNEPFYVHPKGGPYAVVMHPPGHVRCMCSYTMEVL